MTIMPLQSPPPSVADNHAGRSRPRWRRRALALVSVMVFGALAAAYLILPGIWQWTTAAPYHVHDQVTTITPAQDTDLLEQLRAIPPAPVGAAPTVLVYHDISDTPGYYTVSPQAFAAQMQLLHDADYTTITAAQLTSWLRGQPLPPRSVLLTFDDGVEGVWHAADPILARYQQHAMAFVITGFVGTGSNSYYMNWPEITALQASGRWDIESHTARGHVNFTVDAQGAQGPFLTHRHYLAAERRIETDQEYQTRITTDLTQSVTDLREHGLPAPAFFAYPFSADTGEPDLTAILATTVRSLFQASMLDESGGAVTNQADLTAGHIRRSDVVASTDLPTWVANIRKSTPLTPQASDPFAHAEDWTDAAGHPISLPLTATTASLDPGRGWAGYLYAPSRSRTWQHYTVSAILGGPRNPGDGTTTGLRVLADTPDQIQLTVSAGSYEIRRGSGESQQLLAHANLPTAPTYGVQMTVGADQVTITVDSRQVAAIPLTAGRTAGADHAPTGGIELTAQREKPGSPVPQVRDLIVTAAR